MYSIYMENIIPLMWDAHIYVSSYDKLEMKLPCSPPSLSFIAGGVSIRFPQTPTQLGQDSS